MSMFARLIVPTVRQIADVAYDVALCPWLCRVHSLPLLPLQS